MAIRYDFNFNLKIFFQFDKFQQNIAQSQVGWSPGWLFSYWGEYCELEMMPIFWLFEIFWYLIGVNYANILHTPFNCDCLRLLIVWLFVDIYHHFESSFGHFKFYPKGKPCLRLFIPRRRKWVKPHIRRGKLKGSQ